MSNDDELAIGDWIPEIIAVIVFGAVYSLLVAQWFMGDIGTFERVMMWLGFILSIGVLFTWDYVEKSLGIFSDAK